MKIHKNDLVQIMVGKDAGRQGKVTRVFPKDDAVLLDGLNQYKKHIKRQGERAGEIVTLSRPITVAKVAVICPKCKLPTRIGYRITGDKKVRICRKCQNELEIPVKATKKAKK